jgi:hypothetical protein
LVAGVHPTGSMEWQAISQRRRLFQINVKTK